MKRTIRCLTTLSGLAIVAVPSIASAAPQISWQKDYGLFDTNQFGVQQAFSVMNAIPGLNVQARAAADVSLDGGMNDAEAWFEAVGTVSLSANAGTFSMNAAPNIDAYAEFITGQGEQNMYRVQVSYTDFSGSLTYIVPTTVSPNPVSFDATPFFTGPGKAVSWSAGGVEVNLQPNSDVSGIVHAAVDPVHGVVVNATVTPAASLVATAYAFSVPAAVGALTILLDSAQSQTAANATVSGTVAPATEPNTGNLGFCLDVNASWGLEHAMEVWYSATAAGGGSFPGVGPGNSQPVGEVKQCWSPVDGGSWAYYGTGSLGNLLGAGGTAGSSSGGGGSSSGSSGGSSSGGGSSGGGIGKCVHHCLE